jgi:tRNA(fMet)-specific endonuclease VapC
MSARNMGKNDLWIAATTAALGATLITTDQDFDHLLPAFFAIDWVDIQQFSQ